MKAEVEVELRPEKEGVDHGNASPRQAKKPVEDEKFSCFVEVIRKMYIHILMMDAIQVLTYAKYMKEILNQ
jgi:hypothetical protein